MPRFSETSRQRLATCDSRLQLICNEAIKIVDFTIIEGHRDKAGQDAAFAGGGLGWSRLRRGQWRVGRCDRPLAAGCSTPDDQLCARRDLL